MSGDEASAKKDYPRPSLTADVVVVATSPGAQRVLFVKRGRPPFQGMWALPGGFVEPTETVAQAAVRELREETSLTDVAVEELGCFSKPGRDPRGWVVTVAHLAIVPERVVADAKAGDDAAETAWLDLQIGVGGAFTLRLGGQEVRDLAFDHREIIAAAVQRLASRP